MRIKQTMKSLGIISLTAMIIPLILGPTASVYAQEKSTTESSTTEVQQSIEQLKDPLSILSTLDSGAKPALDSKEKEDSSDSLEEKNLENSETEDMEETKQNAEESSSTENLEQTKTQKISPRAIVTFGPWVVNDNGSGYELEQFTGPDTHVVIPGELNGKHIYITKRFLQSLQNTNITDLAVGNPGTVPLNPGLYENNYTHALANNTKLVNVDFSNTQGSAQERSMYGMFAGCTSLKNVKMTNKGTYYGTTSAMFSGCTNLETVDMGTVSCHLPSAVPGGMGIRDTSFMFANCLNLKSVNLSNMSVDLVTNMKAMFQNCHSLTSLDLKNFRTDYVTDMSHMFEECNSITNINMANWVTGNVTTMHKMFASCHNLPQLYISHFDTTKVFDMSAMFLNNFKLASATFSFTTSTQSVISMADMYNGCSSLTSLDVSHMNTQNVQNMYAMFANCPSLVTLKLNGPSFNTQNVVDMSFMFAGDAALTNLDVSHFNTGKVQNMAYMFGNNQNLKHVNVTSFNTSSVTNMNCMFVGTEKIKNLNLTSFNTHIVSNMTDMFKTGSQKELFVLTNDAKILNHGYHLDNRVPPEILLQANYGQFSDSSTSKNFFTRCALTPAQATVSEVKNFMSGNTPTRTNRTFEGWTLVSGIDVNSTGTFTDLFGTIYKAKWNSFGLAQVPTAKTFSGNLNKGTITIPSSGTTNEVGVLDESSDTKGWTLTAQLVWSGTAPNSTTTLRTVSTGTTNEITPTGSIGAAPAGLVTTGANLSISTTPGTVLKGNDSVQQFEGTYVTDLGAISLEIADGSGVIAQSYSGNILWDLAIAP